MAKRIKSSLAPWMVFLLAGCSAALRAPAEADALRARARWPDATIEQLERGRKIYVQKCASCHNLYLPSHLRPDKWPGTIDRMASAYEIKLDPADRKAMLRYLVTMSETEGEGRSGK